MRGDKMKKSLISMGIIICVFILISGCTEVPDTSNGGETQAGISFTEIRICDSPSENFSHINITFSEVKLHSNETGWISFLSEPKIVDLIYLHMNNLTDKLGLEDITTGNYTQLWIVVDNVTAVLSASGETVFFDVPSDTLKIQHLFDFREGNNTITVDINLDDSILIYGDGDEYKLLPVLSELNVSCANGTQIRFRNHERIMNYGNGTEIRVQDENTLQNMIENRKPSIDVIINGSRSTHITVDEDENITFDASETFDIDADTLMFAWDFDDGTTSTESLVIHSYPESGTYTVTLTVSDGEFEDNATIMVTVRQSSGQGEGGNGQGNTLLTISVGSRLYNYTLNDLTTLDSVTGQGSYISKTGKITGPNTYTGVIVSMLLSSIQSLPVNYTFHAIASDGYNRNYSIDEVNGHVIVFNETDVEIGTGNLTMIVAYKQNNAFLSENANGPLRIAFVNTESAITNSGLWLSSLIKIEII
jgi:hypothetical protein